MMRAPILKSAIAGFSLMFFAPLAIAQDGTGAATEQIQALNIPAGPMADALDALVQQSGIQLIYRDADVTGITTAGVRGETTVDAALDVLLQGTELVVTRDATGAMAVGTPHNFGDIGADAAPFADSSSNQNVAAARRAGVEEIIVTGQKKEERLQDVPIAISAFSAEDLNAYKIEGGFDLLKAIPNVSFTKTNFTGYNFQIRGVGTQSISATSDPGVAVSFNGTAIIQNRLFEQEYLDIERVEVLRGPQGTLYGRNSTGGVVNVISARPDLNAFSTQLKSEVGNYNTRRGSAVINIPVVEGMLGLRVAGAYTSRDGYDYNTITRNPINGRDLWTGRVTLGFQPNDMIRANLIWEHFNEDDNRSRTGKQLCHRDDGPETIAGVTVQDPTASENSRLLRAAMFSTGCKAGSLYDEAAFGTPNGLALNNVLGMLMLGSGYNIGYDANRDWQVPIRFQDPYAGLMQSRDLREIASIRDPIYRAAADLLNLNLEVDLGTGLSLHSQTAYVEDETYSFQDYNRFNTVPIFTDTSQIFGNRAGTQPSVYRPMAPGGIFCDPQIGCSDRMAGFDIAQAEAEQFSQELRLQSAWDGPLNFSFGANYTRFETLVDYYVMSNVLTAHAMIGPFNYMQGLGGFDPSQCFQSGFLGGGPAVPTDDPNSHCPHIDPNPVETMTGEGHNYFRSKNPYELSSYAAFGEMYWQFNDAVKLTAGLRYTRDEKRFTEVPSQVLLAPGALAGGYVAAGYPARGEIVQKWGEWTGRLGIDWKLQTGFTDETMVYAFLSRGYKGGGANPPSPGFTTWDDLVEFGHITQQEADIYRVSFGFPGEGLLELNSVDYEQTFEPEFVNALEVGAKNTLFGGAMIVNATAFFYDYTDYQVSQIRDRTAVNENFDAQVWGLELETVFAPTPDLQLVANVGYLNTRVDDGETSIDIMNRTQGNPNYVVAKPWAQLPSNCVIPAHVAAYRLETVGTSNYFQMCGGYYLSDTNPLVDPNFRDPDTNAPLPYDSANYPELNGGSGLSADLGGNELPNSPRLTANLGAQYGIDMFKHEWRATLRGDVYWQDESYHRVYNFEPYDRLKSWHNVNLAIRMEHPRSALAMELYVKNVLNDTPITGAFLNSDDTGLTTNVFTLDPRLIGFSISKTF